MVSSCSSATSRVETQLVTGNFFHLPWNVLFTESNKEWDFKTGRMRNCFVNRQITNYDSFLTVTRNYEKCAETGINVRVERGVGMFLLDVTNGVSGT